MTSANAEYLFEASWEVCNKAGGINTVLRTKAPHVKSYYQNYVLVGPYFKQSADAEFIEQDVPEYLRVAFQHMRNLGAPCRYGTWQIRGEPNAILIDFQSMMDKKNDIKSDMWNHFKVDSLFAGYDFDEPVVWSWASGILLHEISKSLNGKKSVGQFHEWLSGSGLLYLKMNNSKMGTVWTTHATMLGRTLAGSGFDLYGQLGKFDPMQKAREYNVLPKYTMEVACARNADVFTTVSEITGMESESLLGRKPDVLLLNGIDIDQFPTIEETSIKHVTFRGVLREFLTYHFFPYYTFNLNHNLMFFFTGRYEYHNKGMDVLVSALSKLNEMMKKDNNERTVTVFFWVPMGAKGVRVELLENKNYYKHIRSLVDVKSDEILQQIVNDFISKKTSTEENFFEKNFMKDLKKSVLTFQRKGNPPLTTHYIENEGNDQLLNALKQNGLDNRPDSKVKIVVYPVFISENDGLLDLSYYDAMAGCHLGIFPSYYEPWGYTPLEAGAMGLSSVTSDLSGFGMYMQNKLLADNSGINILKMLGRRYDDQINDLANMMYKFTCLDHAERVQNKINAKYLSNLADWKHFVKFYITAHNMSLSQK